MHKHQCETVDSCWFKFVRLIVENLQMHKIFYGLTLNADILAG